MKRISEYAADIFYSRYGGGPRLTGKSEHLSSQLTLYSLRSVLDDNLKLTYTLQNGLAK